jgi:hypothetical protein
MYHALTKLYAETIDGEKEIILPSKKARELINACELINNELKNDINETIGFFHTIKENEYKDSQNMVLVDYELLKQKMIKENLDIVWFVEIYKSNNTLNEELDKKFQVRKSFKYFIWIENEKFLNIKFWEEEFNNQRDKKIIPFSLGTTVAKEGKDVFSVIIPKGTEIPFSRTEKYFTTKDNQTSFTVDILKGENSEAQLNYLIGKFEFDELPKKIKGKAGAQITFTITIENKLIVEAECLDTNRNIQREYDISS